MQRLTQGSWPQTMLGVPSSCAVISRRSPISNRRRGIAYAGADITHRSFGEGTVAGVKTLFGNTRFQADFRSLPSSDETKTFSAERLAEQSFLRMRLTSAVPGFDEFCSQTLTEERLREEATEKAESEARQRQEKRALKAAERAASAATARKAPLARESAA